MTCCLYHYSKRKKMKTIDCSGDDGNINPGTVSNDKSSAFFIKVMKDLEWTKILSKGNFLIACKSITWWENSASVGGNKLMIIFELSL